MAIGGPAVDAPVIKWGRLWTGVALLLMALVTTATFVAAVLPDDFAQLQAAMGGNLSQLVTGRVSVVQRAAIYDSFLAVAYGALGVLGIACLFAVRRAKMRPVGWAESTAVAALALGAAADVAENLSLREIAGRVEVGRALGGLDEALRLFGTLKWLGVGSGVVLAAWLVLTPRRPAVFADRHPNDRPSWHSETEKGASTRCSGCTRHRLCRLAGLVRNLVCAASDDDSKPVETATAIAPWDPPEDEHRLGVCCSGGGIRSAAFSLGVLQVLDRKGVLRSATYLAAVSGGGYMAAGMEVANRTLPEDPAVPPPVAPPAYSPSSPEERHFRNNASYLIPSFFRAVPGVAAVLFGLVLNLLLIWMVLFAAARPVGWLVSVVHPELRAKEPAVFVDRATAAIKPDTVTTVPKPWSVREDEGPVWFQVSVRPVEGQGACMDVLPILPDTGDFAFTVVEEQPAVVELRDARATVIRQPTVKVSGATTAANCDDSSGQEPSLPGALVVERPPRLKVDPEVVVHPRENLLSHIKVEEHPRLQPNLGLRGRDQITIEARLWGLALAPLVAGTLAAALSVLLRTQRRTRDALRIARNVLGGAGLVLTAVLIALPWLIQELPELLATMTKPATGQANPAPLGSGIPSYLIPGGGFVILVAAAVRRFFASNQATAGAQPQPAEGWWSRVWNWLTGARDKLAWYELTPAKFVAGVVVVVVPTVLFLQLLVYASANGPGGRLLGFEPIQRYVPSSWWPPEWAKFVAVVVVLVVLARVVDAHAWSLHPFYKRRLSNAYLVHRRGEQARPVPYDEYPIRFDEPAGDDFPQLILGCAVNLSEVGVTPPARRSASFTFSSTEIGGPLVGYVPTATYWERMGKGRRKDVTVPAVMSISGAAFSPAMGKFNLGPVGSIYAVANLRLGVWLANPAYVHADSHRWVHRPGWSWYIREILNLYRQKAPYVYVSDGGHWENLGLVELLRRGCTRVVCVNAGGDRQESFGTIGEAIALAREELGVEFQLDPSDLRPPVKAAEEGRLLRREGKREAPTPLANASYVRGTFQYPSGRSGEIWLLEPALTSTIPFDIHVYAEAMEVFPDDSTGDQVFNHRQFESYRALGEHQAKQMLAGSGSVLKGSPS